MFSYSVQCVASSHTFSSVNEFVSVNLCNIVCIFAHTGIYACVVRGQYSLCVVQIFLRVTVFFFPIMA